MPPFEKELLIWLCECFIRITRLFVFLVVSYFGLEGGTVFLIALKKIRQSVTNEPRCEKVVFGVSDQVRHKPGCTATEDG